MLKSAFGRGIVQCHRIVVVLVSEHSLDDGNLKTQG